MLYICTLGFIISIFIFYGSVGKQTPGGESLYLGEKEIQVFQIYQQAEEQRYAIELAATLSAKKASQNNFQADFEKYFGEYVKMYGFSPSDYTFTYTQNAGMMTITGITEKSVEFKKVNYVYTLTPDFSITIPYTTTQEKSTESSTVFT